MNGRVEEKDCTKERGQQNAQNYKTGGNKKEEGDRAKTKEIYPTAKRNRRSEKGLNSDTLTKKICIIFFLSKSSPFPFPFFWKWRVLGGGEEWFQFLLSYV